MGAHLRLREEKIDFRRKNSHGLKSMLRDLTKETEGAVAVLVKLLASQDERVRLQAANKLLDLRKECEVIINTDDIQRMLLESKNPDRVRGLVDDDDTPDVDFSTVREIV